MTAQYQPDHDFCYDILRGVAALNQSRIVANLANVLAKDPRSDLSIAFNHKQIGSKLWLRDTLFETYGGQHDHIWVLGGWYGVLSAILFDDPRFKIRRITSIDLDPGCAGVARLLNREMSAEGRFIAKTADMNDLDYGTRDADAPSLIINTSCEHLPDVSRWLSRLPQGQAVLLQSNDYFAEPTHLSSVENLAAFETQAGLSRVDFAGERPTKNYTRFMLIGGR